MKLKFIVTALLLFGLIALETPESLAQGQSAAPSLGVVPKATVAIPVKVIGTAQVAGTVGLAPGTSVGIAGTPNVNVVSLPAVQLAGSPNVSVVSLPAVQLAGSPNVNVVSLPAVQLAGTPGVNVLSMPNVQLAGTTTALAFHQLVTIATGSIQALNNVDVSAYSDVRVVASATGVADFQVFVFVVDENGAPDLLIDGDIIRGKGQGTGLYTIPGRQIRILLLGPSFGSSNVGVSVFGRG